MPLLEYVLTKDGATMNTYFEARKTQLINDGWLLSTTNSITDSTAMGMVLSYFNGAQNLAEYAMSQAVTSTVATQTLEMTNFSSTSGLSLSGANCYVYKRGNSATVVMNFGANYTPNNDLLCTMPTGVRPKTARVIDAFQYTGTLGQPTTATLIATKVPLLFDTNGNVYIVSTTAISSKNIYTAFTFTLNE